MAKDSVLNADAHVAFIWDARVSLGYLQSVMCTKFSSVSFVVSFATMWAAVPNITSADALGLQGELFFEKSHLSGEQRMAVLTQDESFDYGSKRFLGAHLFYMKDVQPGLRIGPGLRYAGDLVGTRGDDDDFVFGQAFDVYARFEYVLETVPIIDLIFGANLGLTTLIPGGDLESEIDRLKANDVSVWRGPRLGVLVSPLVGARWAFLGPLALRSDLMFSAGYLFLFRTDDNVGGTAVRKRWRATTLRFSWTVGFEVELD